MSKRPIIKKWVYSPHALLRIEGRKIRAEELTSIITIPDYTIQQGTKWIFAKTIVGRKDNMIAAVVLEKKELDLWVVITVLINFEKR